MDVTNPMSPGQGGRQIELELVAPKKGERIIQPKIRSLMMQCFDLIAGIKKKQPNHDQELNRDLSTGCQRKFHNKINKKVTFGLCELVKFVGKNKLEGVDEEFTRKAPSLT